MTTDLEKQFFDTFGIEPKKSFRGCKLGAKFYSEICKEPCKGCENEISKTEYPQITDRILLELICILSKYKKDKGSLLEIYDISLNELKEEILEKVIFRNKDLNYQVHSLFKEG